MMKRQPADTAGHETSKKQSENPSTIHLWTPPLVVFLLVLTSTTTLVFGQGSYFSINPAWSSGLASRTASVATGDIDGDGDLDLICGNTDQGTTLYLNDGGKLQTSPAWTSGPSSRTTSVAVGDIDGDGTLDLVCGNTGQSTMLFLNDGTRLQTSPAWSSGSAAVTASVALGDVDGDGDLDLVCGNTNESTTLYLNDNGMFQATPAWSSGLASATRSVALGDIDRDGDLDLVCGNSGQSTTLYLNDGEMFRTTPAWSSGLASATRSVALGDIDGDGDLDLICGNYFERNTLYPNNGTMFQISPGWVSELVSNTQSVVLGDVDEDGDLDFVCGNYNQSTTLCLNDGGRLQTSAAWSSQLARTYGVALGDIDGDGAVDLVCGNTGQSTTLYLNNGGTLQTSPAWLSGQASKTQSIALGDVDGNGSLDLVCGNYNQSATLYLNDGDTLQTSPAWSSAPLHYTQSVALGDIDGNGGLDLVCGNYNQYTTLYLNDGGTLQTMPVWSPEVPMGTRSVTLGDIDGDGDLELVCGNSGENSTLYRNSGSSLQTTPAWWSGSANNTHSVALGDIDGDGNLDLVCGNYDQSTMLYVNDGGSLQTWPAWSTVLPSATRSIALGDVDGDGDLDVVCGNYYESTTLYLNDGGTLRTSPAWSSGLASNTQSVALGDIDGDGDLDLLCGNIGQNTTLYVNDGGIFQISPAWSSELASNTLSIALGDVDQDGDLDLVCGNYDQRTTLYAGKLAPVFKGDPRSPTNHLPNNGAHLRFVKAQKTSPEYYRVRFTARDVESDPIWVVPEYRYKRAPGWYPAVVAGYTGKTGPFATSPAGVADSIEWDTHLLPFDARDVILRLRVVEIPKRVSVIQHAAQYVKDIGLVTPYRPVISTAEALAFPAVTEGDTASADVRVTNGGTAALTITNVVLPAADLRLEEALPIEIAPKASADLKIILAPTHDADIQGDLLIQSDDPFSPSTAVRVTARVRPLDFTLVNLYPSGEIPQGTAIGISAVMRDSVHSDSARVFYRKGGDAQFIAIRLQRIDDPVNEQYYGSVPASAVAARGIEYFVEVYNNWLARNGEVRRLRTRVKNLEFTSVPPADHYGMISVPLEIESPIFGVLSDDLGGADIMKWRMWGYYNLGVPVGAGMYVEVPNDTITHFELGRGYWLITRDAPPIDTAPAEGLSTPTDEPFSSVLSPGWNMVGNPFDFAVAWDSVLVDGVSMAEAESVLVEPPIAWVQGQGYVYDVRVLEPFAGYWVKNRTGVEVTLAIPPREDLVMEPATIAATAGDNVGGSPSEGSWQISLRAGGAGVVDRANVVGVSREARSGWDALDRSEPPMSPGSSLSLYIVRGNERLARDIRNPSEVTGASTHGTSTTTGSLWGDVWYLDVAKTFSTSPAGDALRVEVEGLDQIPEDAKVFLVDRALDQMSNLQVEPVYECFVGVRDVISDETKARFALLIGSDEFVAAHQDNLSTIPTQTVLLQNHPNPFNPTTIIRYDLAKPGMVSLRIYDARGALVRDLYSGQRPAGRYEVGWDGTNERGEHVASGVYFYVLQTPDVRQTKKMVCLK